jgi:hypothetical protein
MIGVMPFLCERGHHGRRYVLVEEKPQAVAALALGRPTTGCASA